MTIQMPDGPEAEVVLDTIFPDACAPGCHFCSGPETD